MAYLKVGRGCVVTHVFLDSCVRSGLGYAMLGSAEWIEMAREHSHTPPGSCYNP